MRLSGPKVQVGVKVTAVSRKASGYGRVHKHPQPVKFDGPTGHKTVVIETPVYARPSVRVYWPTESRVRYPKGQWAPYAKTKRDYGICPVCGAKRLREIAEHQAWLDRAVYDEVLGKYVEPPPARKPTMAPTPEETERKRKAKARKVREHQRKASDARHKTRA